MRFTIRATRKAVHVDGLGSCPSVARFGWRMPAVHRSDDLLDVAEFTSTYAETQLVKMCKCCTRALMSAMDSTSKGSESTRGWHRIGTGYYELTDDAGRTLAFVQKYRSFWNVKVLPGGEAARTVHLPDSPTTYKAAKALAESRI